MEICDKLNIWSVVILAALLGLGVVALPRTMTRAPYQGVVVGARQRRPLGVLAKRRALIDSAVAVNDAVASLAQGDHLVAQTSADVAAWGDGAAVVTGQQTTQHIFTSNEAKL